ncbi:MAG: glycosyltransferase [Candidatus Hydrogenedentes bacterium]|nr:glycosyltransferase [Candidatus Hydrogenedentota bacterium]
MRVVFFGNASERIAAIRYRIGTFARMLEAEGHSCAICLPMSAAEEERYFSGISARGKLWLLLKAALRRLAQLRHVPGADVVFFRGPLLPYGPPVLERICRWLNPRLVFDIDDAIWEPPAHVNSAFLRFVDFGWTRKMAGLCRHGIAGNESLKAYVAPMNPHVTVIPTCIDMDLHTQKDYARSPDAPVILGWTGLKDNLGYLRHIAPALQDLAREYPIRLHVATGAPYALDGVAVVNEHWILGREIGCLQEADIGLMPLDDTPRARGKCAFKALQYMAVGTPVVVSPVGMNAEVVEDGVTGFLADTPEEWRDRLGQLIADPDLRERMGRAARERVRARYSHAVYYPVLKDTLERVARGE